MKTKLIKRQETAHEWYVVDVSGKVLGRAATEIATLLMGKNRPDFTPHVDNGAGVVVINCDKIRVTGKKASQKMYTRFSGYPGGLRKTVYEEMFEKDPKYVMRHAVKGMLPKNKLGVRMLKRLKLYTGTEHPHAAQKPKTFETKAR
jgi:large subunit ribosomal protein L13